MKSPSMKLSQSEMTWFGLALLSLILGAFQYLTYEPIKTADSVKLEGKLTQTPIKHTQGGDMPWYWVTIQIDNSSKTFRLKDCSRQLTNEQQLLSLDSGTVVHLTVDKNELDTEDEVPVYAFSDVEGEVGFTLSQFNRCYVSYWKRMIPFVIFSLIAAIIGFVSRMRGRK